MNIVKNKVINLTLSDLSILLEISDKYIVDKLITLFHYIVEEKLKHDRDKYINSIRNVYYQEIYYKKRYSI